MNQQRSIYVASSWRNEYHPDVVARLRQDGHRVYDFKGSGDGWGGDGNGPGGFGWSEIDSNWKSWVEDVPTYLKALEHPRAEEGFLRDMNALRAADACVMVMPCGPSASMEMGWAAGAKLFTAVYIPSMREPDLMVKMADVVTDDLTRIRELLHKEESARMLPETRNQELINNWYRRNGGKAKFGAAVLRAVKEIEELMDATDHNSATEAAKFEAADVAICLYQAASIGGFDLQEYIRRKIEINNQRTWNVEPDGTLTHVKT